MKPTMVTTGQGMTGVFLDPPYADTADRSSGLEDLVLASVPACPTARSV